MDAVERFLCLATVEKGHEFLHECARLGIRCTVLTLDSHRDGSWPHEVIEDLATMPPGLNRQQILNTVSWMARGKRFDRVIALHEADLETAAQIREHIRVPGMGVTTSGCYRDKLAQRVIARAFGYRVPEFCRVLNYDELRDYMARVPAPWLLRPRIEGTAADCRIDDAEQLWRTLDELGDMQSHYILEQGMTGDLFHLDSIIDGSEVKFSTVHQSTLYPAQQASLFTAWTVDSAGSDRNELTALNRALAPAFGMVRGLTHARFLRSYSDDRYYFLEAGARIGGVYLEQLVEVATGVNLWREWAKLEVANLREIPYAAPESLGKYAGSVICLSQQRAPNLDAIVDPAIATRMYRDRIAGLIVKAASSERIEGLLDELTIQVQGALTEPSGNHEGPLEP